MTKVAVLTDFSYLPPQYGLVPTVLAQLDTLIRHGVDTTLIVMEGFQNHPDAKKIPKEVKVLIAVPFMHLYDYSLGSVEQEELVGPIGEPPTPDSKPKTNLKKQIQLATEMFETHLPAFDVIITHDILYQTWKIPFNAAIRAVADKHPNIKWVHWCHSAPQPRPHNIGYPDILRFTSMPNSIWVTPNESMASGFALQFNIGIDHVKAVYHQINLDELMRHPLSIELLHKHKLNEAAILIVCPTRIDHAAGKRLDKIAALAGHLNKLAPTKLLFLNSWSGGEENKNTVNWIRDAALKTGLSQDGIIFTSEHNKKWLNGVPHQVVFDMLTLSNVFILASEAETFSLITAEAAITKNLLVLNDDLSMMHELYGDGAIYIPFGSSWGGVSTNRNYQPNEEAFMFDKAKEIVECLKMDKPLIANRTALLKFNEEWVWKNQLKPLIEG
jgi:hypothetical protein